MVICSRREFLGMASSLVLSAVLPQIPANSKENAKNAFYSGYSKSELDETEQLRKFYLDLILQKYRENVVPLDRCVETVKDYEKYIIECCNNHGIIEHPVAVGIAVLENGGGVAKRSKAGAMGIYQLMPETAKRLGLVVDNETDQRKDPHKNI